MSYHKELFEAVSVGNMDRVESLAERPDAKANINKIYEACGETLLTEAARQGQYATLEYLLEHKAADPGIPNANGQYPIHYAAAAGDVRCVRILHANAADINVTDGDGKTPLHWAIRSSHDRVFDFLLENGANIHIMTAEGNTCLQESLLHSKQEIVSKLLKMRPEINHKNNRNESLLYSASRAGRQKLVEKLVKLGADFNACTANGETILHESARLGNIKVVEYILQYVKRHDDDVVIPDFVNVQTSGGECGVYGVNVETTGWTALHIAVGQGHYDVVKLLLDHGAKTSIQNQDNLTAQDLCLAYKRKEIMPLFESKKPKADKVQHLNENPHKNKERENREWRSY